MRFRQRQQRREGEDDHAAEIRDRLGSRSLVLIGLMGAGKTAVGRRLANRVGLPFVDADSEIEGAAGKTVSEVFADHGEAAFRDGERRVIARLLDREPLVLATGGGAYMNPETRAAIKARGVSIWLKAELDILLARVKRRDNRPLLKRGDAAAIMAALMQERYPVYAEADITVTSRDVPHEAIVDDIVAVLLHLDPAAECEAPGMPPAELGPVP